MSVSPFEFLESSLKKDAKLFIEEEDDLGETIDLPQEEVLARPLVELKPLPAGLRYAFLNGDKETPAIISDKLSDEETSKLIAILEKQRSVLVFLSAITKCGGFKSILGNDARNACWYFLTPSLMKGTMTPERGAG